MIIDAISDLHGYYSNLDGGDLLIVCGDLTDKDCPFQFVQFMIWIDKKQYRKKIIIA